MKNPVSKNSNGNQSFWYDAHVRRLFFAGFALQTAVVEWGQNDLPEASIVEALDVIIKEAQSALRSYKKENL